MLAELESLDKLAADPGLWADPKEAQATMRRLTLLRDQVNDWDELTRRVDDAIELFDLAEMEEDAETLDVMAQEAAELEALVDKRELKLALSGEHDEAGAILTLHAGEGGTEAQDWTQMLLRMYLKYCDRKGFKADSAMARARPGERPRSPNPRWPPTAPARPRTEVAVPALISSSHVGCPITAAKRKNARPAEMKTSPIDATLRTSGSAMGMTSESGPRWRRNEASSVAGRMMWSDGATSAVVKPAAIRLGSQTGMRPALTSTTTPLLTTPTSASSMPG